MPPRARGCMPERYRYDLLRETPELENSRPDGKRFGEKKTRMLPLPE
jgi:hypothetical protein